MSFLHDAVNVFLHLDQHLFDAVQTYGTWVYLILFVIVFCETGLVVTPFLPGDSLLFAAGALAASGSLSLPTVIVLLVLAAVLGDTANYWIGYVGGVRVANRYIKKEHLDRTHQFYERYGGKTIIIARFVPFVRTFAPFVAGLGSMTYVRFMSFNVVGGVAWVLACTLGGYFFGNLPFVRDHFSVVVLGIVFVSLLPMVFEIVRSRRHSQKSASAAPAQEASLEPTLK
jgi:membrane-associated protein